MSQLSPSNAWSSISGCSASSGPAIASGVVITGAPALIASISDSGNYTWSITLSDGGSPPNFTIDRYDASGVLIDHPIVVSGVDGGVTFDGPVTLSQDPADALEAATKRYVDAHSFTDAPSDGKFYGRTDGAWVVGGADGLPDAPNDGTTYARNSAAWTRLTHADITDWTATLAPYALTASVPLPSTTAPLMDGTAAIGADPAYARADHVHPTDTSLYAASNPAGYQTAAQVTASLGAYLPLAGGALAGNLTVNGSTTFVGAPVKIDIPGGATTSNFPHIDGPVGTGKWLMGSTAGIDRWGLALGDGSAESGSNAGSDFLVQRFGDAGVLIDTPLTINRATGAATFSGPFTVADATSQLANSLTLKATGTNNSVLQLSLAGGQQSRLWYNFTTHVATWDSLSVGGGVVQINADASFQINSATAYKSGGGSWTATSDDRVKTVQEDYTLGLDQVLQLHPVVYTYLGNDTPTADLNRAEPDADPAPYSGPAPYPASPHYVAAEDQTPFVGFIAQELEQIFPGMVSQREGYINGEKVTDLRDVDTSNLIYALVNSVKTLAARVAELEAASG